MKISHILFDDYPFIDNWGYQENKLIKYQITNDDIIVVAGRYVPTILQDHTSLKSLERFEERQIGEHVLRVYRLDCVFGNSVLGKKIKYFKGLKKLLLKEKPDYIFVHDLHSFSLISVNNYLRTHDTKCVADVHINYANSCSNKLSYLMHRYIYRPLILHNISRIAKIYYLNDNCRRFIDELYGLNKGTHNIGFLPLGGEIAEKEEIINTKNELYKKMSLTQKDVIFLHSGKFTSKKKTNELISSFIQTDDSRFRLLLIGSPDNSIKSEFDRLVGSDKRILYLGWKKNHDLMKYLMLCDVYLQPGSPSVTAHEAMCKGCATVLSTEGNHYSAFVPKDCAIYISSVDDLNDLFNKISEDPSYIDTFKTKGYELAKKLFDYKTQARIIIQ